jgi:transposase
MIASNIPFKAKQIAKVVGCSRRTIQRKKSNIRKFGSIKATPNRVGRSRSIAPPMLDTICGHLLKEPGIYLEEMMLIIWDKFKVEVTTSFECSMSMSDWVIELRENKPTPGF